MSLYGSYAKAANELIVRGLESGDNPDTWMLPVLTLLKQLINNKEIKAIYEKLENGMKSGEPVDDWISPTIEDLNNFIGKAS